MCGCVVFASVVVGCCACVVDYTVMCGVVNVGVGVIVVVASHSCWRCCCVVVVVLVMLIVSVVFT